MVYKFFMLIYCDHIKHVGAAWKRPLSGTGFIIDYLTASLQSPKPFHSLLAQSRGQVFGCIREQGLDCEALRI